jgi:hypothetical protein
MLTGSWNLVYGTVDTDCVSKLTIMSLILQETADVDNQLVQFPGQEMEGVIPVMSRAVMEQKEKIDLSRQQYLAATIAAREPPSEELLTLVGELRKQLEAFLIRPSLMNAIFVTKQC